MINVNIKSPNSIQYYIDQAKANGGGGGSGGAGGGNAGKDGGAGFVIVTTYF